MLLFILFIKNDFVLIPTVTTTKVMYLSEGKRAQNRANMVNIGLCCDVMPTVSFLNPDLSFSDH